MKKELLSDMTEVALEVVRNDRNERRDRRWRVFQDFTMLWFVVTFGLLLVYGCSTLNTWVDKVEHPPVTMQKESHYYRYDANVGNWAEVPADTIRKTDNGSYQYLYQDPACHFADVNGHCLEYGK